VIQVVQADVNKKIAEFWKGPDATVAEDRSHKLWEKKTGKDGICPFVL
jgi:hypothetical protein